MKRQKTSKLHARYQFLCNFCVFQHVWSELYCKQALQQRNGRAWVCLGPIFFCAGCSLGWKKSWAAETQVLVLSFSPLLLLFQYWPSLLSFFCVSHHGQLEPSAASLPSTEPGTPWKDFWCCLFQVELETAAKCRRFLIQSPPG